MSYHNNKLRRGRKQLPVPAIVSSFMDTLLPVRKRSTCKLARSILRTFHDWLDNQKLPLDKVDRRVMERWLKYLADCELAPITRCTRIYHVKNYLNWLFQNGHLHRSVEQLLRFTDLPKIPSYLPRPFNPDIDKELQTRFLACNTLYGQALFLLRRTGLRIGELIRLEFNCLDFDLSDNFYIKVPLGKLDNERLVPIDDDTRAVVESMQQQCTNDASFLIESNLSRKTIEGRLRDTLKKSASGLDISGPVVPHRLRHTYATELINAGMSLMAIMKLLGHRSFRMTMRYAAVTQQTVANDYHLAMANISKQYQIAASDDSPYEPTPDRLILNTIAWLRKNIDPATFNTKQGNAIIKRLYQLHSDISAFLKYSRPDL